MKPIELADVERLADEAHIRLTDEEKQQLTNDLQKMWEVVLQLEEADVTNVPPTAYGIDLTNALRADENKPSIDHAAAMQNAPEPEDGMFRVPRIMD